MESASTNNKYETLHSYLWRRLKESTRNLLEKVVELAKTTKKLGDDDPRRVIHAMKVGTAITIVSLFYYFEPLYDGFGASAMWAVMTVVVVFEFYVGATLARGLNRGFGTFIAGGLGFCAHHIANSSGQLEPVLLGVFVFLLATVASFIRFFPWIKARYDYGILIFIVTFCLISLSGYRDKEILAMAHQRVSTILIGGSTALCVCVCISPAFAGDDLHKLISGNIETLGIFLEGFRECLQNTEQGDASDTSSIDYENVLNSKQNEESLANFARWEPRHGPFKFNHPWKQYLKIGNLTRQCAYNIQALGGYLHLQIQSQPGIRSKILESCFDVSLESGKALKELALAIKTMSPPDSATNHIINSSNAAKNLKSLLNSNLEKDISIIQIVAAATIASLLIDIVSDAEKIAESIQELASLAKFKSMEKKSKSKKLVKLFGFRNKASSNHVVVEIVETSQSSLDNNKECDHIITIDDDHHSIELPKDEILPKS
ncbi:hypothetical protein ACFE04_014955 [Oxalis oulophora]